MKATGMFFLCAPAAPALTRKGERVVIFRVLERDPAEPKNVLQHLTARWSGNDATQFFNANEMALRPGTALLLEMDRLRSEHDEIVGNVVACSIAPPRWPARNEQPQQNARA